VNKIVNINLALLFVEIYLILFDLKFSLNLKEYEDEYIPQGFKIPIDDQYTPESKLMLLTKIR